MNKTELVIKQEAVFVETCMYQVLKSQVSTGTQTQGLWHTMQALLPLSR